MWINDIEFTQSDEDLLRGFSRSSLVVFLEGAVMYDVDGNPRFLTDDEKSAVYQYILDDDPRAVGEEAMIPWSHVMKSITDSPMN